MRPRIEDLCADLEISVAANQLVKRHGEDAGIEAAKRADAMIAAGA